MDDAAIRTAAELLAHANSVCVSSGAGMSAESGVATFRDETGYWSKFNPEELASRQGFARDPEKVWAWYRERRQHLTKVQPNAGHLMLAEWETRIDDFAVITQNIDGLHHVAGSKNIIELHGRLDSVKCTFCDYHEQGLDDLGPEPHCPLCHKWLRPDVVWFGEMLPDAALAAAFEAARRCNVIVVIGTSGVVQPAASLAELAKGYGARFIEVNPNDTALSKLADVCIRGGAAEALPAIDVVWREIGS